MRAGAFSLTVVLALSGFVGSCKQQSPARQKGVFADPRDGYFNGETNALVLYEYSFRDPNLPSVFLKHPRTGALIEDQKNAFCLYMIEFAPETPVNDASEIKLFKSARSVTAKAVQRKSFNEETQSYWDAFKSNFSLRTSSVWVSNELVQDEIYGMRDPKRQSDLTKTAGGIRALRRYIEVAKAHEDQNGGDCPASHPKSDKLTVPDETPPAETGASDASSK